MGFRKILGGKKAKTQGAQFEAIFKQRALWEIIDVDHHETSARAVKTKTGLKFIAARSGYDFTLSFEDGLNAFIDCKTFDSDRITHSQLTEHQVKKLADKELRKNIAGYVIYFRKTNKVCFVWASKLQSLQPGDSIMDTEMDLLGTMESFRIGILKNLHYEKHSAK